MAIRYIISIPQLGGGGGGGEGSRHKMKFDINMIIQRMMHHDSINE